MSAPIRLGSVIAGSAEATYVAGASPFANVFSSDLKVLADCAVRMTVTVDAAVKIFRREGGNNIDIGANVPFVPEVEETFLFDMARGESFNIRFSANCTIRKLTVFEIDEGVV